MSRAHGSTLANWSGSVRFAPREDLSPATEAELASALAQRAADGRTIRPIGAGHSFMPIARTDDVLLRADRLSGLISVDAQTKEATFWGGTRLREIATLLTPWGLALANMGDIDVQSIAGAVSTATHGTGLAFTGFSGMVTGLRLALPDGTLVDVDAEHDPELFEAARAGFGAFGIITRVRIRCVDAFALSAHETTEPIEAVLESFPERARTTDHVEFFWFPGTPRATVKTNRRLPHDAPLSPMGRISHLVNRELLGNVVYGALLEGTSRAPRVAPAVRDIASRLMAGGDFTDHSHRVFSAPRRVRFEESEYAVPAESFGEAVREVERAIRSSGEQVTFPLEVRIARGDDTWLGTASGRDTVYIAVHRFHREPFSPVLRAIEPVFAQFEGRPHWGKRHTLGAAELSRLYPRFADAQAVRRRVDPTGALLSPEIARLLEG
ncbi:FAD-binding protein [Brachybacterium sp. JHP9]|uniref:FAD-binding protein n=1 Tax=Brachybacterium equifaecis TaxID=2910770 RepID=A0ABT0R067_9MICO|nr:FAD-binding protein [Brachybacterium equifaecis]